MATPQPPARAVDGQGLFAVRGVAEYRPGSGYAPQLVVADELESWSVPATAMGTAAVTKISPGPARATTRGRDVHGDTGNVLAASLDVADVHSDSDPQAVAASRARIAVGGAQRADPRTARSRAPRHLSSSRSPAAARDLVTDRLIVTIEHCLPPRVAEPAACSVDPTMSVNSTAHSDAPESAVGVSPVTKREISTRSESTSSPSQW